MEQFEKQEFKALSPGIGLGPKRPGGGGGTRQATPMNPPVATRKTGASQRISAPKTPEQPPRVNAAVTARVMAPTWGIRLQAYVMDFFLVVTTLAVAFAGVVVYTVYNTSQSGDLSDLWQQRPVQLLASASPLLTLGLVYAVCVVYMLFFKLLVGSTCGESLLGISTKIVPSTARAKQKNF